MKKEFKVIIPARKKSKRLKGKNIRVLNNKPLISYSIEYALENIHKNNIWINTDDNRVIEIAKKYKVNFYKRPKELARDDTPTKEVIIDNVNYFESMKIFYTDIIILQPTNPFRPKDLFTKAIDKYRNSKRESLFSVSELNKKFGSVKNGKYKPINYSIGQRFQEIEKLYYENGLIYISSKKNIIKKKKIIDNDAYPYLTKGIFSNVDIDTIDDFKIAEIIAKKYHDNS